MSLISKFLSIFKTKKPISVNLKPLFFSETGIQKIMNHLENRPANVKSAFKVSVIFQKEKVLCQVGFDDYKLIRKTLFEYPVPLIIAEQDELFLRGSYIDYHAEEEAYFYYPNVHLEVSDRENESIFVFHLDRFVISPDSPIKSYALGKENFETSLPYLINLLFETKLVESIFLENNFISVEKIKEGDKNNFEEKMADIILSYFEKCGYPLYITDSSIEAKPFGK
jgi:hypothetical protein